MRMDIVKMIIMKTDSEIMKETEKKNTIERMVL